MAIITFFWWQTVRAFQVTLGLFVDAFDWFRGQMFRRRISVSTNKHRAGGENTVSVWQTIRNNDGSEFGLTPVASHRDQRGWRYSPQVWVVLGRVWDEQNFARKTAEAIESLRKQISWMLANPPLAVTEHGVVRSEYRAVTLWEAMSA